MRRGELCRTNIIPSDKVRLRRSCLHTLNLELIVQIDVSVVLIASTWCTCTIDVRPASRHKVDQTVSWIRTRIITVDRQLLSNDITSIRQHIDVITVGRIVPCGIGVKLYVVQRLNLQSTLPCSAVTTKCLID